MNLKQMYLLIHAVIKLIHVSKKNPPLPPKIIVPIILHSARGPFH